MGPYLYSTVTSVSGSKISNQKSGFAMSFFIGYKWKLDFWVGWKLPFLFFLQNVPNIFHILNALYTLNTPFSFIRLSDFTASL